MCGAGWFVDLGQGTLSVRSSTRVYRVPPSAEVREGVDFSRRFPRDPACGAPPRPRAASALDSYASIVPKPGAAGAL